MKHLLLDLDPYGGTDRLSMFPLFLKRTADVMAPNFSVVFRRLVRLGSFPVCWRQANATQIPKGPPSSPVANYRPISITSVLSNVFERLVSVRLGRFMERVVWFQPPSLLIGKKKKKKKKCFFKFKIFDITMSTYISRSGYL